MEAAASEPISEGEGTRPAALDAPRDAVKLASNENPLGPSPRAVAAAADGQMLPLIFFCVLFGLALTTLPPEHRRRQLGFWETLFEAMMKITGWVIATAPLGIFGLMARITASSGFEAFGPLARYGMTVIAALLFHAAITLPVLVRTIGGLNPLRHVRVMAPALLTANTPSSTKLREQKSAVKCKRVDLERSRISKKCI